MQVNGILAVREPSLGISPAWRWVEIDRFVLKGGENEFRRIGCEGVEREAL